MSSLLSMFPKHTAWSEICLTGLEKRNQETKHQVSYSLPACLSAHPLIHPYFPHIIDSYYSLGIGRKTIKRKKREKKHPFDIQEEEKLCSE